MNGATNTDTAMSTHGLTALSEKLETAGSVVWWRLSGGLDLVALRTTWEAEGLPVAWLPSPPSYATALRRALTGQRGPKRLLRTLGDGSFVLVDETEHVGDLQYETVLKARLDKVGRLEFSSVRDWGKTDIRDDIRDDFTRYQDELIQADVSPWLCKVMDRIQAVGLRDTGGIYFVPRFELGLWESAVRALRASSLHVISCVPAVRSDEAASAVFEAITMETQRVADVMARELSDESLGARALDARIKAADAVEMKVAAYEKLFGGKLEALHEKMGALRAQLTIAIFKAQDAEAAEAATP